MITLFQNEDPWSAGPPLDSGILQSVGSQGPGVGLESQPATPSLSIAPPSAGLGMAPEQPSSPASRDPRVAAIRQMGTLEKVLSAIGSFGAGVTGQSDLLVARIKEQQQKRLLDMQEFQASTAALKAGMEIMDALPEGERAAFAASHGTQLEKVYPGMGGIFKAAAVDPSIVTMASNYMKYLPEPIQALAKARPREFRKWAGTKDGIETLTKSEDAYHIHIADLKAKNSQLGADQYVPKDVLEKYGADGRLSFSEYMDMQQYLPENLKLTDRQLKAVKKDPKTFSFGANLIDPQTENEISKAKQTAAPTVVDTGGTSKIIPREQIPAGGMEIQKTVTPGQEESNRMRSEEISLRRSALAQAARFHAENIAQGRYGAPVELSIDGKNIVVTQEKKTGRLIDTKGNDVTAQVAPKITGGNLDPGRIAMQLQASKDVGDAEALIFDKDGELNRGLLLKMEVPGTRGVGTDARKAYSSIENAVSAKLRGETGAATNPGEIENTAARFRPTIMDTSDSAKYKLDRLREFMTLSLDQLRESNHISQATYEKAKARSPVSGPKKITNAAEHAALKPGEKYIGPDGSLATKR